MITTHCSAEMWRNMDHLCGYSPIFIPRKLNCQPLKDTGIKFCYRFYGKHFFFQSQLLKKKVKMSSISRLKIKLILYILCMVIHVLPFYGMMGGKFMHMYKYVRVWLCIFMYNYVHVHVYWYWFLLHHSYSVIKLSSS